MKQVFIFDVDGTLTPSRETMDPQFRKWFKNWIKRGGKEVYFASGSDYVKTQEQLGNDILDMANAVFSCAGNAIYTKGVLKYQSKWTLKDPQIQWLNEQLFKSLFTGKSGRHIENRIGLVNFSVVGRAADKEMRKKYIEFDKRTGERRKLAEEFNKKFGDVAVAQVAGETGIDLMEPGKDKGQIAQYFVEPSVHVHFFGDQMEFGGNDFPLGIALKENYIHMKQSKATTVKVKSWKDTWNYLKKLENEQ
jgi:phosphomannomutase